jgi:hypothetical protein
MNASASRASQTAPTLSFGPYANAAEATICIQRFIDTGFAPDTAKGLGIIWAEPTGAMMLRPAALDREDQVGASLLVQWHGAVKPAQPEVPKGTVWQSIEDAVRGMYEKIGQGVHSFSRSLDSTQAMLRQNDSNPYAAAMQADGEAGVDGLIALRSAWRWAEKELATHPKTAAGISFALDAVAVVTGLVGLVLMLPEVVGVAGVAAFVGAATATGAAGLLAAADGGDVYYLAIKDNEAAEIKWDDSPFVRRTQLIAPLLALPDAVRGGAGVARDIGDASGEVRAAQTGVAQAAGKVDQAAAKLTDQQAANAAKTKIYKGDRQKVQNLVARQKNAAKRLRKANKILEKAREELKTVLLEKSWPDVPNLLSAAGGTGVYFGNIPTLTQRSTEQRKQQLETAGRKRPKAPADHLMPSGGNVMNGNMPHYISCGIVVSSPLQNPGTK